MEDQQHRSALSRRRFLALTATGLSAIAAGGLLTACQQPQPAQPTAPEARAPATTAAGTKPNGEAIKIGVIQPLSGPVAASGGYVRSGAEIARDWINDSGGVLGRPIQLLVEDNKSDPKEAASAAEKLIISDRVPALMGAWGSSMTLAAMPKLEQYGVPMLVETSSASSITTSGNPWVFRISPPSTREAEGMKQHYDDLKITKADFLAVNTDFGRGAAQAFGDMVKGKGGTVGAVEYMDQAAVDMGAPLTKIKQSGGDTLFITTAVEQLVLTFKHAEALGLSPTMITTGGSSSPDQLVEQAGTAAEGTYHIVFFMPWFPEAMPDPELSTRFIEEWRKRGYPEGGLTEGFRGHDGIKTLAEAIKLAGQPEPKAIRDALWKVDVMGLNGPITFQKEGPPGKESGQNATNIFLIQIEGGKITLPPFVQRR
jgi:branched-chain amino acid transport system substrate-binding protein